MYFSAADEAEFGQQAEHATVVEVGVYPEAACAALPGQCHGAAHEFGRYAPVSYTHLTLPTTSRV